MNWWKYVVEVSGTDKPKAMSDVTDIDAPHFSKWKGGHVPRVEIAAKFARAYQRPVLEAFVAAGFLSAEEAGEQPTAAPDLDSLTDDELIDELQSRLRRLRGDGDVDRDAAPIAMLIVDDSGGKSASRRTPLGDVQEMDPVGAFPGGVVSEVVQNAIDTELGEAGHVVFAKRGRLTADAARVVDRLSKGQQRALRKEPDQDHASQDPDPEDVSPR